MSGSIHLAIGPMFSGKTEWLIDQLEKEKKNGKQILPIRFSLDTRYSDTEIVSHNNKSIKAVGAESTREIIEIFDEHPSFEILGIDEIQFYDPTLVDFCRITKKKGITIFVAGLDTDFRKLPWETTESMGKIADSVVAFKAVCSVCKKKNAIFTKRLSKESSKVLIGGEGLYSPRCKIHYNSA